MKDAKIEVRLSAKEKAEWTAWAESRGLTVSEFVRRIVSGGSPGPPPTAIRKTSIGDIGYAVEKEGPVTAIFKNRGK